MRADQARFAARKRRLASGGPMGWRCRMRRHGRGIGVATCIAGPLGSTTPMSGPFAEIAYTGARLGSRSETLAPGSCCACVRRPRPHSGRTPSFGAACVGAPPLMWRRRPSFGRGAGASGFGGQSAVQGRGGRRVRRCLLVDWHGGLEDQAGGHHDGARGPGRLG